MPYQSTIKFECPECKNDIVETIEVPETYWSGDNADERYVSDTENVFCTNCAASFELDVGNQDGTIFITIENYHKIKVSTSHAEFTGPTDDDYLDIPSDSEINIYRTLDQVRHVLDQHGSETTASVVNRMVFSQQVAVLEAYLADTLLWAVKSDANILQRIVSSDSELKDQRPTLSEVLADPHLVLKNTIRHLQAQLYHNLAKVDVLYKITVQFSVFPDTTIKSRLFSAMPIRHDCVHRNGYDKEGVFRNEITAIYVRQFETDVRALVRHVETQMEAITNR